LTGDRSPLGYGVVFTLESPRRDLLANNVYFSLPYRQHDSVAGGLKRRRARIQIAVATLSGNSLRQTVHTHCASVHQAAKLVAAPLRTAGVPAGLAESIGSLPPGL